MISWLKGTIQHKGTSNIILNVRDVGYEVYVTEVCLASFSKGQEIELFTHHVVREDAQILFGFLNDAELFLFKKLISVSGIGPKIGLAVLNGYEVAGIIEAITYEKESVFSGISGIGPKTARRIILELKGKIEQIDFSSFGSVSPVSLDTEVMEALESLGYSIPQIREALKQVSPEGDTASRLKQALKYI